MGRLNTRYVHRHSRIVLCPCGDESGLRRGYHCASAADSGEVEVEITAEGERAVIWLHFHSSLPEAMLIRQLCYKTNRSSSASSLASASSSQSFRSSASSRSRTSPHTRTARRLSSGRLLKLGLGCVLSSHHIYLSFCHSYTCLSPNASTVRRNMSPHSNSQITIRNRS